jgi:hypothetical protein
MSIAAALTALVATTATAQTYTTSYVVTPSNVIVQALVDSSNAKRQCQSVDAESTTPSEVKRTGANILGWSFIKSPKTFGYATWIAEKSGLHTTYLAHYILRNCTLTETRSYQKTFDGKDREARANAEYNRLILMALGK